jgi:hypothetical protein
MNTAAAFAQQVFKGLPPDLKKAALLIVKYEPKDLIPADAKSYEKLYASTENLQARADEANLDLSNAAKYGYPFNYRIISKAELAKLKNIDSVYIFEPAVIYSTSGPWGSVPLYLRNPQTQALYEVGTVPKNGIYSAEKVMDNFLKPIKKTFPMQALDDYDGD